MVQRVIVAGNNQIAIDVVRFLKRQPVEIVGLIVHPSRQAKKRLQLIKASELKKRYIFVGSKMHQKKALDRIKKLKPDLILSINFRYLLRKSLLAIPRLGAINLHYGYLPYNRGVFADAWSIIDETPAGVTYHLIDEGVDTGKIVARRKVEQQPTDTAKTLYKKLTEAAYELFLETWPSIKKWSFKPRNQAKGGTYHKRADVDKIDEIQLNKRYTAKDLINILRARTFPPHPGAYFRMNRKKIFVRVKLDVGEE